MKQEYTAIILAAGQGTRLRPLTDSKPKCLVEVSGKSLLQRQIDTYNCLGINRIIVVAGYMHEKIDVIGMTKIVNPDFESTNMVYSLMCAKDFLKGNVIVSYGDIFFSKNVLQLLINAPGDITVASDLHWQSYWQQRFINPLEDAETFEVADNYLVKSLGQKPADYSQIDGQFIGLIKLSNSGTEQLMSLYNQCASDILCNDSAWDSGKTLKNAFMTDILNEVAKRGELSYCPIYRGWFEIDAISDLNVAESQGID